MASFGRAKKTLMGDRGPTFWACPRPLSMREGRVPYSIRICYEEGHLPPPGNHHEWTCGWYATEKEAERAALDSLVQPNEDRIEIRCGQDTVVREVSRWR